VHPEILGNERISEELIGKDIWQKRFQDIENFERYLSHNGVVVRKFFLNVSKAEQSGDSWSGWKIRRRIGNFPLTMSVNASAGTTT